jgi:hypothetical protein
MITNGHMPRFMMYGEVYLYRTRKPGAILGLPIFGRHNGYTGQTRNPKARHEEHIQGGGRYGQEAKDWSDLDPKRHVLFRMRHCPQWALNLAERLAIYATLPVYNDKMNRHNPRRISLRAAHRQRMMRDATGWSWSFGLGHALTLCGVLLAAGWMVIR